MLEAMATTDTERSDGVEAARQPRRRVGFGCLAAVAVGLVLVVAVAVIFVVTTDWGPHARGLASTEDVRPLPSGVVVVAERAGDGHGSCGGNGDGWHPCERRLRVRMPGVSRQELAQMLADHYRSSGHEMADLRSAAGAGGDRLFGPASCDEADGDRLCLYIEEPNDQSDWPSGVNAIPEPPGPGDVDVVARTWAYYL